MIRFWLSIFLMSSMISCKPEDVQESKAQVSVLEKASVPHPQDQGNWDSKKQEEAVKNMEEQTEANVLPDVEADSGADSGGVPSVEEKNLLEEVSTPEAVAQKKTIQRFLWQTLDLPAEFSSSADLPSSGKKRVILLGKREASKAETLSEKKDVSFLEFPTENILIDTDNANSGVISIASAKTDHKVPQTASVGFQYHPYMIPQVSWWEHPVLALAPMSQTESLLISPWAPSVESSDLENLLHEAHESLEGGHPMQEGWKGKLQEWVQNFNIHDFVLNGYRWIQMKKLDPRFKNDALNVAFLFGVSHGIETMAGPAALMWAQHAGAGPAQMGLIGTVGFMISIPGFDPLCMVLASFYKTSDKFRRVITQLRVVTVKTVRGLSSLSGASLLLDRAFAVQPAQKRVKHWLEQKKKQTQSLESGAQSSSKKEEGLLERLEVMPGVQMRLESHEKHLVATELILERSVLQDPEVLTKINKAVSKLGYSFTMSLKETLEFVQKKRSQPFFIQKVEEGQKQVSVRFEKGAVFIRPQVVLRKVSSLANQKISCDQLF